MDSVDQSRVTAGEPGFPPQPGHSHPNRGARTVPAAERPDPVTRASHGGGETVTGVPATVFHRMRPQPSPVRGTSLARRR